MFQPEAEMIRIEGGRARDSVVPTDPVDSPSAVAISS